MKRTRILLVLSALSALLGAACIIGPKHEDPEPGLDSADTGTGTAFDTARTDDTASLDVASPPDAGGEIPTVADTGAKDAASDGGDAGKDTADGDAPEADAPADILGDVPGEVIGDALGGG